MSKRSFRPATTPLPVSYPSIRAFFARHRPALAGIGLSLLTSGVFPGNGCGPDDIGGVPPYPPAPLDARIEMRADAGRRVERGVLPDLEVPAEAGASTDVRPARPDCRRSGER